MWFFDLTTLFRVANHQNNSPVATYAICELIRAFTLAVPQSGVRQLETDDMAASELYSLQFHITVGASNIGNVFRGSSPVETKTCFKDNNRGL